MTGTFIKRVLAIFLAAALAPTALSAAPLRILALGDSLMQGFGVEAGHELPAVLEARLRDKGIDAEVINAGVSGDTSAGGRARLDWALADRPDAAIVALGSNDALRGLAPEETEKNLDAILARLRGAGIPVLLAGMMAPRNLGPEYAAEFDPIYPRLAEKHGAILYPFLLDGVALDPTLNQADGIHPNAEGVALIAGRLLPSVEQLVARARSGETG